MNLENKTLYRFALLAMCVGLALNITGIIVRQSPRSAAVFVSESPKKLTGDAELPKIEEKKETTLMFVGDIMLSRAVGDKMKKLNNWNWPFEKITDYLAGADLMFGNLEGPVSERGKNVGSEYSFRASPKVVEGLKYAGFDVLSVANNHIGDWTKIAMDDTFAILKDNGIEYAGGGMNEMEAHSAKIKEVNGIKFGFLAYTALGAKYTEAQASSSGIAWLDKEKMEQDIAEAKKSSDIIIVSMHFGEEYEKKSNVFQQDMARAAIDAGAKLVIGHHPHVVHETEQYHGGFIAYSLGNFIFDQNFSKETMEGMLLKVIFEGKDVKSIEPIKINISKQFQASLMEDMSGSLNATTTPQLIL
jgi:poly-gamma-glutamate capsule biosynthesis protein CapA/YwtB (metallophosphatase superfamily)